MSSETAIEAARLRLASAKKWNSSAQRTLEFAKYRVKSAESEVEASHKEMEEAWTYLMNLQQRSTTDNDGGGGGASGMNGVSYVVEGDHHHDSHHTISSDGSNTSNNESNVVVSDGLAESEFAMMKIYISGCAADGRNLTLKVLPSDTIGSVKTMIQAKLNIPTKHFYLTYCGKFLDDTSTLIDCKVKKKETIQFHLRRRSHGPVI